MHELSLCRALVREVETIASTHQAIAVRSILIHLGPLSGAEATRLRNAYPVAAAGSIAEEAALVIESTPIRVHCLHCGEESDTPINQLTCGHCGRNHPLLISGDEIELVKLEFDLHIH
ncbi:hydrogenase nickel incorporation protein HypA [Solemya pervernicosa gill symbiont]|uniref:Hydrogenase maturation factor HypA n=2 Tax=Gammaproteobacteria incertae sedis TaxID=118884 RepID=A0A1T2L1H9_9GAMM|nr:hydrogenase maturation nickel metallochaperone HypA [Candidatus Reidiella endopervernicosa]OOZ38932.1 hydrogenase nickel incorporation protein HypA [Solemya pervernicosa gill symbiont]QKQ26834.1 hydrogenase maturation nickel metallochaperone HypA [Candidatus Reidiella endopervernicosa]